MSDYETVAATELHSATRGPAGEPYAPGQPLDITEPASKQRVRSLAGDAWFDLRRNPIFWVASVLVLVVVLMAVFPGLFTRCRSGGLRPQPPARRTKRRCDLRVQLPGLRRVGPGGVRHPRLAD